MFDKRRCRKCKFHGTVGHFVQLGEHKGDYRDNQIVCDYLIKSGKGSCLKREGKDVVDQRGEDPNNCQLFEEGEIERSKQWFQRYS